MWLLTLLVLSCGWAASACPETCSCHHEQGLYVANCSSLPNTGGKIEVLNLLPTSDDPLELNDGQFISARHLKYLNLRNSSIYYIHKKALYGAKNILEIDLSFNYIEELEPTVFQHLTSLTTLILRGNSVKFMSEVPFLISNSLQHLDIGECKITSIPRGIFYGLKRLKYLSIDGNFLKSLKYNSLPKGLKYLNLSNNLIVNVPTEVISALTNLRRIGLGGNPINCSCSLLNLQDWLSGRGVIFEDNVTCSMPSEYYGISWSKVDENRLCLDEARREDISHSTVYYPLFKNKLYRGNYFDNENSYLGEHVQSDQPQSLLPDPQTEVLFQNNQTLAMGEMMRDEEGANLKVEEDLEPNKDGTLESDIESDIESATIGKTPPVDQNIEDEAVESQGNVNTGVKITGDETKMEDEEVIINVEKETDHALQNASLENTDLSTQGVASNEENKVEDENEDPSIKNVNKNVESTETSNLPNNSLERVISLPEKPNPENVDSEGSGAGFDLAHSVNLNEATSVEYKTLNEDVSNADLDDFKKEGLYVESNTYNSGTNDTSENSTVSPDIEEGITEDEESPTEDTPVVEDDSDIDESANQNITLSSEPTNGTIVGDFEDIEPKEGDIETEPPPIPNDTEIHENSSVVIIPDTEQEPPTHETNSLPIPVTNEKKEDRIRQVAGAEVVMFCIATIVICLILYSVYKCRTSNRRQTMIVKDMESNRGTELQDMASLLPKPQNGEKKNNLKYPDKAPSSETVKLITEQNENEPNFTPAADANTKVEDKNTLNNNTPSSPTSKTPLIKSGNPVTINPAAPIQRTKVKVGIIPDSIPRTPIFLQKTYNNGTKHV